MRIVASAVEGPRQMLVVGSRGLSDLGPVEESHFIGSDAKGERSPSACTVVRRSLFVARSIVPVSI